MAEGEWPVGPGNPQGWRFAKVPEESLCSYHVVDTGCSGSLLWADRFDPKLSLESPARLELTLPGVTGGRKASWPLAVLGDCDPRRNKA